jgi:diguanylate cyclase
MRGTLSADIPTVNDPIRQQLSSLHRAVVWLLIAVGATEIITLIPPLGLSESLDTTLWLGLKCLAALALSLRVVTVTTERHAWSVLCISGWIWFAADIIWATNGLPEGFSISDPMWISSLLLALLGAGKLMHARLPLLPRLGTVLDCATVGLCTAAILTIALYPALASSTVDGWPLDKAINTVYPVLGVTQIALLLAGFGAMRGRPDLTISMLTAGIAVGALGDFVFAMPETLASRLAPLVQIGWTLGTIAAPIASLAGAHVGHQPQRFLHERADALDRAALGISAIPVGGAIVAASVLISNVVWPVPALSETLGAFALVSALMRMVSTQGNLRLLAESRREARTDELTGLGNRRGLMEHLERSLRGETQITLMIVSIDGLNDVSRSFGEPVTNEVLRRSAGRLTNQLPAQTYSARLSEDEFAFVTARNEGDIIADCLRTVFSEPLDAGPLSVTLAPTIGMAHGPQHGMTNSALLRAADVALHQAKRDGHSTATYQLDADPLRPQQLELFNDAKRALTDDAFTMFFQPKVTLRTGEIIGFEALVRWEHPVRGFIGPSEFLPVIERFHLSSELTRSVIRISLGQMAAWREDHAQLTNVAINISPADLLDDDFPMFVTGQLQRFQIEPSLLTLEVTEGSLISDSAHAERAIHRLRVAGVRISLDDFGIGFSSLSHLAQLSLDELKLDQSLSKALVKGPRAQTIVTATASMAKALGLRLVVEGIEDDETRRLLIELGCEFGQGYFFARPQPAADVRPLLTADTVTVSPFAAT